MKKTVLLEAVCPCCKGVGKITRQVSLNQDVTTAEVKMMRQGGMTMQEIADHFGWASLSTVDYHLKKKNNLPDYSELTQDPVHDFFTAPEEVQRPVYERALQKAQEEQNTLTPHPTEDTSGKSK